MSKKKQQPNQIPMSDERFIKERMRNLEIGTCYCTEEDLRHTGEGVVIISRKHTGGRISFCCFLLDTFCLGVKDVHWMLRIEDDDLEEVVNHYDNIDLVDYVTAHNWIYGALAFAEDAGIQPCKEYRIAQFFLQEDGEDVPILEFPFGKDGKHFLVANDLNELNRYMPILKRNLGDDFTFTVANRSEYDPLEEDEDEHENIFEVDARYAKHDSVYSYQHPVFPKELKLCHPEVYDKITKERGEDFLSLKGAKQLLSLPKEELRIDLEQMIYFMLGRLYDNTANDSEYLAIGDAIMLLGEVGNSDSSLDAVLETMRVPFELNEEIIGDWSDEILVPVVYKLGNTQMNRLKAFMLEEGLNHFSKYAVVEAVCEIVGHDRKRRKEVIDWFRDLLTLVTDGQNHTNQLDPSLLGLMMEELINIQAGELLPEIEKAFQCDAVNYSICGMFQRVRHDIMSGWDNYSLLEMDLFKRIEIIEKKMREIDN